MAPSGLAAFKRQRFVRLLVLVCGLGAAGGFSTVYDVPAAADPPQATGEPGSKQNGEPARPRDVNVVIFLIDTLRADRLGVYGYAKPTSPRIDELAAEGVVFERCHANAPWTLPSVVSLLTSTFPCEHRVLVDGQKIEASVEPLAARLKGVGYTTLSLYANSYAARMSGLGRGYDVCRHFRATDGVTVARWLDQMRGGPFLLYVHNVEPHDPHDAPDRLVREFGEVPARVKSEVRRLSRHYRQLTRVDFKAKRPLGTTDNAAAQAEALRRLNELRPQIDVLYDATVRHADERVGSVIDVLKRRGLWDQTLFILVSDHGEELGDRGGWQHDQSVYEELVRVPLIIRFPHGQFAGRRIKAAASLVDVMPTIFDYLRRGELSTGCRGTSLMPLVRGEVTPDTDRLTVTAMRINRKKYYRPYKRARGDMNVVIQQDAWKGIWNVELDSFELYDLAHDPLETADLSAREVRRVQLMRAHVETWLDSYDVGRKGAPDAEAGGPEGIDEEALRVLRSLGYVD